MTEQEWLACDDPDKLLAFARDRFGKRKYRLFACASVRRVAHLIRDPRATAALDFGERMADRRGRGRAKVEEAAYAACEECWGRDQSGMTAADMLAYLAEAYATHAAKDCVYDDPFVAAARAWGGACGAAAYPKCRTPDAPTLYPPDRAEKYAQEKPPQVELFRDIVGNPFRPVVADPVWLTDTAMSLARQMYESRDFSAMPILADALQDAGCDNTDILNHCRDANATHVRGCWVVDLVLGR